MVTGFEVHVDAAALADMESAEEAARAHVAAVRSAGASAGGTATMSGPHAARIQSAGGTAGGKATMSGPHAARIQSAGGTATMSGPHAARIHSAGGMTGAGGKAGLGKKRGIYKKKHQTAAQAAHAEYVRKYRAAKLAALPVRP